MDLANFDGWARRSHRKRTSLGAEMALGFSSSSAVARRDCRHGLDRALSLLDLSDSGSFVAYRCTTWFAKAFLDLWCSERAISARSSRNRRRGMQRVPRSSNRAGRNSAHAVGEAGDDGAAVRESGRRMARSLGWAGEANRIGDRSSVEPGAPAFGTAITISGVERSLHPVPGTAVREAARAVVDTVDLRLDALGRQVVTASDLPEDAGGVARGDRHDDVVVFARYRCGEPQLAREMRYARDPRRARPGVVSDYCGAGDDQSRQNADFQQPPSADSSALPCLIKELADTPAARVSRGDSIRHRHDEATIASTIRDVESVSAC